MNEIQQLNVVDAIFAGFGGGVALVHGNEVYNGSAVEWVRLSIQGITGRQISLGNDPIHRYWSFCNLQIFTKPDIGDGRSAELVDLVTVLLRSKQINGLTFRVPRATRVGVSDGWYQVNVQTEFYRED